MSQMTLTSLQKMISRKWKPLTKSLKEALHSLQADQPD